MTSSKQYQVGYKKPPKDTQFKKGQSGNPKGRPKKKKVTLAEDIYKELQELMVIKEHGETKTVSKLEALIKKTVNDALNGDKAATKLVINEVGPYLKQEQEKIDEPIIVRWKREDE